MAAERVGALAGRIAVGTGGCARDWPQAATAGSKNKARQAYNNERYLRRITA
jgi:hypothetical protein